MEYDTKNKGVWAEATGMVEKRIGPKKILRKVLKASLGGEAGEAARKAIITGMAEAKKRK